MCPTPAVTKLLRHLGCPTAGFGLRSWNANRVQMERLLVDGPMLSVSAAQAKLEMFG